jgi:3-oxoacyl-[acyl-carrier-protein] synthase-1
MMATRCKLTALGIANALGGSATDIRSRLFAGQSGLVERCDAVADRTMFLGEITDPLPEIPDHLARFRCRNNAVSLLALRPIEASIRAAIERFGPNRIGVIFGTSTSGVSDAETALRHQREHGGLAPGFDYAQLEFGGGAEFISEYFEISGPAYTISTACSSGARALASARSLLALGICDAVIAGATDTLCNLTIYGFSALQAISDEITNPCSVNRKGLSLGEASSLFLVTRDEGGVQLLGVGESSEAHHMSAPDPTGAGAESAMREALQDADIAPSDVLYLNLHGTGTPLNDSMECAAVGRVLGLQTPCSSTKPLVGHTLGAAGATEAGFCMLALESAENDSMPLIPHRWDGRRDPEIPPIQLVEEPRRVSFAGRAVVVTNSFGFGGNNCVLVLGRE